jgi:hypothetical protein
MKNAYKILHRKPEGKIPHWGPGPRIENNIIVDPEEIVYEGVDWIQLSQDRDQLRDVVNTVMNLRFP